MTDPRDTSASSCPQTSGQQLAEPTAPGFPGLAPNCQASWSALLAGPKGTCSVLGLLWEPSSSSVSSSPLPLLGGPHLLCSSSAAPVPLRQEQPAPGHAPARPPAASTVVQTSHRCWPHPNMAHRPPGSSKTALQAGWNPQSSGHMGLWRLHASSPPSPALTGPSWRPSQPWPSL